MVVALDAIYKFAIRTDLICEVTNTECEAQNGTLIIVSSRLFFSSSFTKIPRTANENFDQPRQRSGRLAFSWTIIDILLISLNMLHIGQSRS